MFAAFQQTVTKTVTHRMVLKKDEPFRVGPYSYSDVKLSIIRMEVGRSN